MFYYCKSLTNIDLSNFNTQNVTYMSKVFKDCVNLEEINLNGLKNFKTDKVIDMSYMFQNCGKLESLDLEKSIFFKLEQLENIKLIFETFDILKLDKFKLINEEQL